MKEVTKAPATPKSGLPAGLNAIQAMAARLMMDPEEMKDTLKMIIFPKMKVKEQGKNDTWRETTDQELMAFCVTAETYKLNPIIKEIYAYPDTKKNAIIPIVSTDGWTKLITKHPDYVNHEYVFSEDEVDVPETSHKAPRWIEIHITKRNGTVFVLREYFLEVYRKPYYDYIKKETKPGPWQSHPNRMLRHKVKIQGGRDCFGFTGIFDQDEAERIAETTDYEVIQSDQLPAPAFKEPKEIKKPEVAEESDPNGDLNGSDKAKDQKKKTRPLTSGQQKLIQDLTDKYNLDLSLLLSTDYKADSLSDLSFDQADALIKFVINNNKGTNGNPS